MVPVTWNAAEFFVILGHFLPFYPTNKPKKQNFERMKKMSGDIVILHKCNKNHDHMLHCSWDMVHGVCNLYFSFWAIFCPLTLPHNSKKQSVKKLKKTPGGMIILHMCTHVYQKLWSHDHRPPPPFLNVGSKF